MKVRGLITALFVLFILIQAAYSKRGLTADDLNKKGMQELLSGNNSSAAEYFRKAITEDPSKKNYYNNLAASYMRMNDYYSAEEQLQIAIAIDPVYTKALSNMSVVLFKTGRYRDAYEYYIRSKNSDPLYTAERFEKNKVLVRLKEESRRKPDDQNLKRIILQLESSGD